jgi:hypothetical protein
MDPDSIIIRCNHCGTKNRLIGAPPKSDIEKNMLSVMD